MKPTTTLMAAWGICLALPVAAQQFSPMLSGSLTEEYSPFHGLSDYLQGQEYTELADKRSAYSRAYRVDDGRVIYEFSKAPLNYETAPGQWEPVSTDAVYLADKNAWLVKHQPYPLQLDRGGNMQVLKNGEPLFSLRTVSLLGHPSGNDIGIQTGQDIRFLHSGGIIQHSTPRINGVKTDFILPSYTAGQPAVIRQQLVCPKGTKLIRHPFQKEGLSIRDAGGTEIGCLYPVVCYDAAGQIGLGHYETEPNADGFAVTIRLDEDWLSATGRQFPVTVDPLVTGPVSVWAGGFMPSCDLPNYNIDSLQVTIPAEVTITGVFVTSSYYADPFTIATMSNGEMFFSTSCGSSPQLTVAPPTGNTPGTAYLDNFDYRSPLTCCMGASCSQRTFYVRMHLGRNIGGAGCAVQYIYYDPASLWPFSVYVEGHTAESAGSQWNVTPASVCSDDCDLTVQIWARYGVPPYTVSHPWAAGNTVFGNPVFSCNTGAQNTIFHLTRPNCPQFCDTTGVLNIPLPQLQDACGNIVAGLPNKTVTIKPTPQITVVPPDQLICSGDSAHIEFQACPPGTVVNWSGGGFNGTNTIDSLFTYTGTDTLHSGYIATASLNGCHADTITAMVSVMPNPLAGFSFPDVAFVDMPVSFADSSNYLSSDADTWAWDFGDGSNASDSLSAHTYTTPGTYQVCLTITTADGCRDTLCDSIEIVPQEIVLPDVITPNADGTNDVLYIQYLEFFGQCQVIVYNRWGFSVYRNDNYLNDWNPGTSVTDGTYFYIVRLENGKEYTSTLNIFTNP